MNDVSKLKLIPSCILEYKCAFLIPIIVVVDTDVPQEPVSVEFCP